MRGEDCGVTRATSFAGSLFGYDEAMADNRSDARSQGSRLDVQPGLSSLAVHRLALDLLRCTSVGECVAALEGYAVPALGDVVTLAYLKSATIAEYRYVKSAYFYVFPLVREGHAQLQITLQRSLARGPMSDAEFEQMRQFCEPVSYALQTALRYENTSRIAATFQTAALRVPLPNVPGFRFDALYHPGDAAANVGGDWYEAYEIDDGRIVVSVGDVMGSGIAASVQMMNIRQTLRAVGSVRADPLEMLAAAERAVERQYPGTLVSTAIAVLDPITRTCSYANAGHPGMMLRDSSGNVRELDVRGTPLGAYALGDQRVVTHVSFDTGNTIVLYTDGLIEQDRDVVCGLAKLTGVIADLDPEDAQPAATIFSRIIRDAARDDVAILTVSVDQLTPLRRWRFDPMWDDVGMRVQSELREALDYWRPDDDLRFRFDIVLAEVLANLMRHAPGAAELVLEFGVKPTLHALDTGSGFAFSPHLPPDLFSESGRGLFLIDEFSREISMRRRPGGGSHLRIVL
jgi:serine phosphatase RsbU (regulator of sigma subunit)/anti-sigma regulatory factor (Ser/Thr protein kinase)